ncbi:MAG TPA: toxin-antitoxin system HicB family antitoxin [Blastocatellia bacterium]|nr:toxin-antitoxin system HicB family antitoxin [Blastocatellia bacterium]
MSSLSLRLPESLHQKIRELAERDNISINQFIATASAEKAAALLTVGYLEARAGRADRTILERLLDRVPDAPAMSGDSLSMRQPNKPMQPTRSAAKPRRVPSARKKRSPRRG